MHKTTAAVALASALLASPALAAGPSGALYERTLMLDADRRCGLFAPDVRSALTASRLQARTASLRAKQDAGAVERRARLRAAAVPCGSADLETGAARVRYAHAGWSRLMWMDFPGARTAWRADRVASVGTRWRLVQKTPSSAFGLAGRIPQAATPLAVTLLPRRARPALARVTVGQRVFLARTMAEAPETLVIPGRGRSWSFAFPQDVSAALAALPPNGAARLEVLAADEEQTVLARMAIEPGDYAAALAFLQQPTPVTAIGMGSPGRPRPAH
jgi:hypothetical protein